ncbi:TPA: hypothetical protein MBI04_003560 [Klebsiella pneumoniae]|nr:hypothetical protein [Klebsiella pneumoniae]
MGLFGGSSSASSSSTNNSSIWDDPQIEQLVQNINYQIQYSNETLDPLNQYMQNALNYMLNPERFNTAKNLAQKGGAIWNTASGDFSKLKGITPAQMLSAFESGTQSLYGDASTFMAQQDQSIENSVMAEMGSSLAQNAETQHAGGAVAGSSAMNNSAMGILEGGAESIEGQESKVAAQILSAAARTTGSLEKGYLKSASNLVSGEFGMAGKILKAAAKSGSNAGHNYWNAALVEQAYEQKQTNVNRKNSMVNNNSPLMAQIAELAALLESGGASTSSTTSGTASMSGGGLL